MEGKWNSASIADLPIHIGDGNYSSKYPKASEFVESGIPFITASDFSNGRICSENFRFIKAEQHSTLRKGHIKFGDVLVVTRGNGIGDVAWVDQQFEDCNINAQLVLLRADEKILHNRYLYYLLSSREYKAIFVAYGSGSAQPQLPIKALKPIGIRFPSFEDQVSIANILESLDDKIELNRQMNATLVSMAQTLFKSWFVDFDPVIDNALAAGNTIPEPLHVRAETRKALGNKCKPLPEAIQKQFPSRFVLSEEMGWMPERWTTKTIEETASSIGMGPFGSNIKVDTFVDSGVPILNGQHLNEIIVVEGSHNYITEKHAEKLHKSLVYSGDLVFTHRGTIGQVSLVPKSSQYDKFIVSQSQMYLRPDFNEVTSTFLICFFRSHHGQHRLLSNASQVGVPSIARPSSHLKGIKLVLPVIEILKEFDKLCGGWLESLSANRAQTKSLEKIRDVLLPELLSGKLRIPDAEKMVADAV